MITKKNADSWGFYGRSAPSVDRVFFFSSVEICLYYGNKGVFLRAQKEQMKKCIDINIWSNLTKFSGVLYSKAISSNLVPNGEFVFWGFSSALVINTIIINTQLSHVFCTETKTSQGSSLLQTMRNSERAHEMAWVSLNQTYFSSNQFDSRYADQNIRIRTRDVSSTEHLIWVEILYAC